jgi:hypothetical protein
MEQAGLAREVEMSVLAVVEQTTCLTRRLRDSDGSFDAYVRTRALADRR